MLGGIIRNYQLAEIAEKCDSISSKATVLEFVTLARQKNIEVMPVVDEEDKVIGIVTEKDLIKLVKIEGPASNYPIIEKNLPKEVLDQPITVIMTANPVLLKETSSLEDAMNLVLNHDFRRIIVVDSQNRLVGKLRIADIIHRISKS